MKNQKGITLVALVVTIVVLLILAATSIAMLRGDSGIVTNAQRAKYANVEGEVIDKITLAYNGVATSIRVDEATITGYNAQDHVAKYADEIYEDLLGEADETFVNSAGTETSVTSSTTSSGYTVSYVKGTGTNASTITVTYKDNDFGGTAKSKYTTIVYTITINGNVPTLSEYTRQVSK